MRAKLEYKPDTLRRTVVGYGYGSSKTRVYHTDPACIDARTEWYVFGFRVTSARSVPPHESSMVHLDSVEVWRSAWGVSYGDVWQSQKYHGFLR